LLLSLVLLLMNTHNRWGCRLWRCAMGYGRGGHLADFSNLLRIPFFAAMDFAMNTCSIKTIWWWAR